MVGGITIENYEEKRRELIETNSNLNALVLRESEKELDRHLAALKKEYLQSGRIDYSVPVLTDAAIRESGLYRFCSRLPKGADLHVHDTALLPVSELIPLLLDDPAFCISRDRELCALARLCENDPLPEGYLRFSEALRTGYYTKEELVRRWTVTGNEPGDVWEHFEKMFIRFAPLSDDNGFAEKYYLRAFRYYCENNVLHLEIHMLMRGTTQSCAEYVKTVREAYYTVKKEYPHFTVRIIGAGYKADNEKKEKTRKCFLNASYVQSTIRDESTGGENFLIGFDLVNEEDGNLTLHDFAPMLLTVKERYPEMNLYLHGGESLDAGNENLIDAYLLGVSRVGHGLNLYRYPDLHSKFIESEICLEVCPISNRALRYTRDIRNHPAVEYLRTGLPIALCSDDPAYMEHESLTDDWFAALVCWDLKLADLKQLGINSILYCGLERQSRTEAIRAYNAMWKRFVEESLTEYGR